MRAIIAWAFISGLLFALGLGISEMTSPNKVRGFLDLFGAWDPSLMFVMMGAIAVHSAAYWLLVKRIPRPRFEEKFHIPQKTAVDFRLLLGAALFGIGWGVSGYCPGPTIVSLATLQSRVFIFAAAMIAGMWIYGATSGKIKL